MKLHLIAYNFAKSAAYMVRLSHFYTAKENGCANLRWVTLLEVTISLQLEGTLIALQILLFN